MRRVVFISMLLMVLMACKRDPTINFPPPNTDVVLTSTNLPIVWIETRGRIIDRYQRIEGRMRIIDNGPGKLNYLSLIHI